MGERPAPTAAGSSATPEAILTAFARLMGERYGARIYLFGSRVRGTNRPSSDYDVVAVAESFGQQPRLGRAQDRFLIWREAGGWGAPLDLHCYTPAEFREELRGLGYLGQAKRRGQLVAVLAARPHPRRAPTRTTPSRRRRA